MIKSIRRSTFWAGQSEPHYFHPSVCRCREGWLMTMQTLSAVGDTYGPVLFSISRDRLQSWSEPSPIPALAHLSHGKGLVEAIADVRPEYHAKTGSIIAIGCNTYYSDKGCWIYDQSCRHLELPQYPVYAVRRPDGLWGERLVLEAEGFTGRRNWRVACAQFLVLPDGDVLLPVYHNEPGENVYSVCTVLCGFDGERLRVKKTGATLSYNVNRGLIEPSLAECGGSFYMTIRAEDGRGYYSVSEDGLSWRKKQPWRWENGECLEMSTTQQHWVSHDDELFLVYTRRTEHNGDVMRWRAPLFLSRFDRRRGCLERGTEMEVLPLMRTEGVGNMLGNFHAVGLSADSSLVSVGSSTDWVVGDKRERFFSEVWLAEIIWESAAEASRRNQAVHSADLAYAGNAGLK